MADYLKVTDADAVVQQLFAKLYGGSLYPQMVDWTVQRVMSANSTNATSVKAAAGTLAGGRLFNTNASVRFLKLYNKASAPTVGTDTPLITITLTPGVGTDVVPVVGGLAFSAGIAYALTTGVADTDTAAVAANEITGFLAYK